MPYVFDITVSPAVRDSDLFSRILAFKEDLYRECVRARDVVIADERTVDSALEPMSFAVRSKPALARFTKLIQTSPATHCVESVVTVNRR